MDILLSSFVHTCISLKQKINVTQITIFSYVILTSNLLV